MAARLINGMRGAMHAEDFSQVHPDDFTEEGQGPDDYEDAREEVTNTFPSTLGDE